MKELPDDACNTEEGDEEEAFGTNRGSLFLKHRSSHHATKSLFLRAKLHQTHQ